jgi:hypothetical protein
MILHQVCADLYNIGSHVTQRHSVHHGDDCLICGLKSPVGNYLNRIDDPGNKSDKKHGQFLTNTWYPLEKDLASSFHTYRHSYTIWDDNNNNVENSFSFKREIKLIMNQIQFCEVDTVQEETDIHVVFVTIVLSDHQRSRLIESLHKNFDRVQKTVLFIAGKNRSVVFEMHAPLIIIQSHQPIANSFAYWNMKIRKHKGRPSVEALRMGNNKSNINNNNNHEQLFL